MTALARTARQLTFERSEAAARRGLATAAVMAGAGGLIAVEPGLGEPVIAVAAGLMGLSALTLHVRHAGVQLFNRASWIAVGVPAAMIASIGHTDTAAMAVTAGASLVALLSMGFKGLGADGGFTPKALTKTFSAMSVLGFIAAIWSGFVATLGAPSGAVMCALGAASLVGAWGLARMRVWGLLTLVVTALVSGGLAMADVFTPSVVTAIPMGLLAAGVGLRVMRR